MKSLGNAGDKETETEVLLLEHDVPHLPFSQSVLSFLPKMPWGITEDVSASINLKRRDHVPSHSFFFFCGMFLFC